MAHPYLMFCPYLNLGRALPCGTWELGPLEAFDGRWADPRFETQAKSFLQKFVDTNGKPIERPTLIAPRQSAIDGTLPTPAELEALESAIGFAFLDRNPRLGAESKHQGWQVITTDTAELFVWPVDVEEGYVTVTSGLMVRTHGGGYTISDPELVIRPPLDLHSGSVGRPDEQLLSAVYTMVLGSVTSPGANITADRLRVAIGWLLKAWRNTATVHFAERVVFLKTAFEAITATNKTYVSAERLRALFESLTDVGESDHEQLLWSPAETENRTWTWTEGGKQKTDQVTELEYWFNSFGAARNKIIHDGIVPSMAYAEPGSSYEGHYVFTAEYLLRAVIKVSMGPLGYPDLWRSECWRAVKAAFDALATGEAASSTTAPSAPQA